MKVVNYVREHQKLVIYLVINLVPRVLSYPPTRHSLRRGGGGGGGESWEWGYFVIFSRK